MNGGMIFKQYLRKHTGEKKMRKVKEIGKFGGEQNKTYSQSVTDS